MLNRILQTFFLCLSVILLTTEIAWSYPLPNGVLMAEHIAEHNAKTPVETANPNAQTDPPSPAPPHLKGDRAPLKDPQPAQANPAVPYDPYDYNVIRAIDREIYGEAKGDAKRSSP